MKIQCDERQMKAMTFSVNIYAPKLSLTPISTARSIQGDSAFVFWWTLNTRCVERNNFTFTLPSIVIHFFLNNQPYAPARKLSTNLYDIYHCWVYSEWTPDDGQTNCPKHVAFHVRMILIESCLQTCMIYTIAECTVNELLMMGRGTVRNM